MFNQDFYPTPKSLLETIEFNPANKVILEPSAGKGNILDFLKEGGAKKLYACEIEKDLIPVVKSKSTFLKENFLDLQASDIVGIDAIFMNPPFSDIEDHILHAWDIAPSGCELVIIAPDTLRHTYTEKRRNLKNTIEKYGYSVDHGAAFENSERSTKVEIQVIYLFKPLKDSQEFLGFESVDTSIKNEFEGLVKYDYITDVVNRYVESVIIFEENKVLQDKLEKVNVPFDIGRFTFTVGYNENIIEVEDYKIALQKKAWIKVFSHFKLEKFLTSNVRDDINRFIERQSKIPFSVKNIYNMVSIILNTKDQILNKATIEIFDTLTKHTHENRYHVEGWKSNSSYMLTKKIVVPYIFEESWDKTSLKVSYRHSYENKIQDLIKVMCNVLGHKYDEITRFNDFVDRTKLKAGQSYSWAFFKIKGFKKGTLHLKFQNEKDWELLNRKFAEILGQNLPEKI